MFWVHIEIWPCTSEHKSQNLYLISVLEKQLKYLRDPICDCVIC